METGRKMAAFRAFGPFYCLLNVYEANNFRNTSQRLVIRNVCLAIGFSAVLVGFIVAVLAIVWHGYECNFALREIAPTFGIMITSIQIACTYIAMVTKMHRVNAVIGKLEDAIKERCDQSPKSQTIYMALEERFAFFAAFAIKYSLFIAVTFFTGPVLVPVSYLILGHPEPDHWVKALEYSVPLPGVTNVFVRHYTDWIFQLLCCMGRFSMSLTPTVFFIGVCLYISGMKEDLRTILAEADHEGVAIERLVRSVSFHNELVGLANAVNEILSVGLFFQLLVCAVSLAVYMTGLEKSSVFSMNFLLAFSGLAIIIASAYIYCYLSETVSSSLAEIGDIFYQVAWYRLPAKQQKPFVLPIRRAQKEFRMNGLGVVSCSLRVFASIIRTAWSYFLILKA